MIGTVLVSHPVSTKEERWNLIELKYTHESGVQLTSAEEFIGIELHFKLFQFQKWDHTVWNDKKFNALSDSSGIAWMVLGSKIRSPGAYRPGWESKGTQLFTVICLLFIRKGFTPLTPAVEYLLVERESSVW